MTKACMKPHPQGSFHNLCREGDQEFIMQTRTWLRVKEGAVNNYTRTRGVSKSEVAN